VHCSRCRPYDLLLSFANVDLNARVSAGGGHFGNQISLRTFSRGIFSPNSVSYGTVVCVFYFLFIVE